MKPSSSGSGSKIPCNCPASSSRSIRNPSIAILFGGSLQKFAAYHIKAPQPYPTQAHALLEFGKQGFDLIAGPPRTLIGWRSGQRAYDLPSRFLLMHEEPAIGRGSTALLLRTVLALRRRRAVGITLTIPALAAIAQRFSFRAIVDVLRRFITELVAGEVSTRLMATIDDWDVGLHAASQQPGQTLSP